MSVETLLLPLGNGLSFSGLILLIGSVAFYWLVLEVRKGSTVRSAAQVGAVGGALLLIGLALVFTGQLLAYNLPPDPLMRDARALVRLPWGRVWAVEAVLALIALRATLRAGRPGMVWVLLGVLAFVLSFGPAFAGHAVAEDAQLLSIAADGLHVLAAGLWIGTLGVLAASSRRLLKNDGPLLLARVRRFSRLALIAVPVVVLSGIVSAWLRLERLTELWASPYGRVLLVKLVIFACAIAAGFYNWRRATPALAASGDPSAVRASIRFELLFAFGVILVTAILVRTALPGEG